ncbi:Non-heme chloroperoxidase [Roseovarius albus]|uniref:Non-heme chloroperoxidase n=1 Tax=Roseovarius albus TaxID=1247867 RepID=A0A1X7A6G3_9RHOB|nr:alpha/beta hydrolase [Roseovarius albus]SLN71533.1 Non-heme chloroperoxidase [Roseovarius albus]
MKFVSTDVLEIAFHEFGPADGPVVILMHGFPYDPRCYDDVAALLAKKGIRSLVPYLRGYGPTRFLFDDTPRSGEQAALGADLLAFMDALDIQQAVLGGFDWGGRAACIVAALWPERVQGLLSCGVGYNIQDIAGAANPAPPEEEALYWYMYYFHTLRGRTALENNRKGLCQFIWKIWSPTWAFDQATYDATAASFENSDFVDIVIHSYQHRFGGIPGDPSVAEIEARLATQPDISAPSIIFKGADDGVDPPSDEDAIKSHFKGEFRQEILPGVGHNPPQEAPENFTVALLELLKMPGN